MKEPTVIILFVLHLPLRATEKIIHFKHPTKDFHTDGMAARSGENQLN